MGDLNINWDELEAAFDPVKKSAEEQKRILMEAFNEVKKDAEKIGERLDYFDKYHILEDFMDDNLDEDCKECGECEERLASEKPQEKTPDHIKEEIFTICLNYLHEHTEEELLEVVALAVSAAGTFGYIPTTGDERSDDE